MTYRFFATLAAALLLPATSGAGNWADVKEWPDFDESKRICRKFMNVKSPESDRPDAKSLAALTQCDSEMLYYGIGQQADPVASRSCAFAERNRREDSPLRGDAMLMTIYANGVGAKRRLDVAIALACTLDGAPAEIDGRVKHLYQLMAQNWTGHDFSWCDDITSGLAQGYCADHNSRIEGPKRAARLAKVDNKVAKGPAGNLLLKLKKAAEAFIESRGDSEVSPMGTAHTALTIGEKESLQRQFVDDLEGLASGKPPCAGAKEAADADAQLNAIYRKIQRRPANEFMEDSGNVEQSGIKETQLAWLKYRDAWVAFVAVAYPNIAKTSLVNCLTQRRVEQLAEFVVD